MIFISFCFFELFVSTSFVSYKFNPILRATAPKKGSYGCEENIYSQELFQFDDGSYGMLYGGWDKTTDCHDRIFLAVSRDLSQWRKYPSDSNPQPVLDHGSSNHVNDPSLIYFNSTWLLFYTDAGDLQSDRVWVASSKTLTKFSKVGQVVGPGGPGSWNELKVGRPVIHIDQVTRNWYLWYDGTGKTQQRCVGLSISTDHGATFQPHPSNPLYCGGGGIDVKFIEKENQFWLVEEGGDGVHRRVSKDGVNWTSSELILKSGAGGYDRYGTVVPSIFLVNNSMQIWFGGAQVSQWDRNNIAVAYEQNSQFPTGGGCSDCTSEDGGLSCTEACGFRKAGYCADPGSKSVGECCACFDDPCANCLPSGISDCHEACTGMQYPSGYCEFAGSHDPTKCCRCVNPVAKQKF